MPDTPSANPAENNKSKSQLIVEIALILVSAFFLYLHGSLYIFQTVDMLSSTASQLVLLNLITSLVQFTLLWTYISKYSKKNKKSFNLLSIVTLITGIAGGIFSSIIVLGISMFLGFALVVIVLSLLGINM